MRKIGFILLSFTLSLSSEALTIASAANFKPSLVKLVDHFEKKHPNAEIKIVSAASGMLYTQIQQGAPFDIYLSADAKRPKLLEQRLDNKSFVYALGRLVFWKAKSPSLNQNSLLQYTGKLAIANPKIAPYGLAAMETLSTLNLMEEFQDRLIRGNNVNQSYQFVYTGNVAAGLIAQSQMVQGSHKIYWLVPKSYHKPIEQRGILINSNDILANKFVAFMQSNIAQVIIQESGYDLPM